MSSPERITRRGTLQPVVLDGAPGARIRLERADGTCTGCAAGCGNATREELLLSGSALLALGGNLPAAAQPVFVSVARNGLDAAAALLFGLPLAALLAGALLGERMAAQGGAMLLGYAGLIGFLGLLPWLSPRMLRWLALRVETRDAEGQADLPAPLSGQISKVTVN